MLKGVSLLKAVAAAAAFTLLLSSCGVQSSAGAGASPTASETAVISQPASPTAEAVATPVPTLADTARGTPQNDDELYDKWKALGVLADDVNPDNTLTLSALTSIIVNSLRLPEATTYKDKVFNLEAAGLLSEASDDTELSDQPLTREQAAVLLVNAFERSYPKNAVATFADYDDISQAAKGAVALLQNKGCLDNYQSFEPGKEITIREFLWMLDGLVNDIEESDSATISGNYPAGVVISAENAVIYNAQISGSIYLAYTVKTLTIQNSSIDGCIYVGLSDIRDDQVSLQIKNSDIGAVTTYIPAYIELDGAAGTVTLNAATDIILSNASTISKADISADSIISGHGAVALARNTALGTTFEYPPSEYLDISALTYAGSKEGYADFFGDTYYIADGKLSTGITKIGENNYYFDKTGVLLKNQTAQEDLTQYVLDENGAISKVKYSSGDDELDEELDEIIASETDDTMGLEDKMFAVYKWTYTNIKYRATPIDLSNGFTTELVAEHAQNTLDTRRGACEHFAIITALLFNRLGVETILIQGQRYSTYYGTWDDHSWVLAKLDGKYWHFDGLYEYQHIGVPKSCFKKTDEEMSSHHKWDTSEYPACEG